MVANYIHRLSKRKKEPFVALNCQIFPEGVIDSELFGHEKGSFTGASETRIGKFEQANFGTLFLDEIGDLPITTQGKLLRAIESKRIERLGSNKSIDLISGLYLPPTRIFRKRLPKVSLEKICCIGLIH